MSKLTTAALAVFAFGLGIVARPAIKNLVEGLKTPSRVEVGAKDPADPEHWMAKVSEFDAIGSNRAIVMLGDSRFEGGEWSELLDRQDVSKRGISGDTVLGLLRRLDRSIPSPFSAAVIQVGVNDLRRGASVTEVVAGVRKVIATLLSRQQGQIILTSVIPFAEKHAEINARIAAANAELAKLALDPRVHWLDLTKGLGGTDLASEYSLDGVHCTGAGFRKIATMLEPLLPKKGPP